MIDESLIVPGTSWTFKDKDGDVSKYELIDNIDAEDSVLLKNVENWRKTKYDKTTFLHEFEIWFRCTSIWVNKILPGEVVKVVSTDTESDIKKIRYIDLTTGESKFLDEDSFLDRFKFYAKNDLNAIYYSRENKDEYTLVYTQYPGSSIVDYHIYGGERDGVQTSNDIDNFHKQYAIFKFNAKPYDLEYLERHEFDKLKDCKKIGGISNKYHEQETEHKDNLSLLEAMVEGSIWKRKDDSAMGTIIEVRENNPDMVVIRFDKGTVGEFNKYEILREWERVPEEDKTETYLKTDVSKMKEFGSGAKREDKSGKGRYDLIPGEMMHEFELYTYKKYFAKDIFTRFSKYDVSLNAYFDEVDNVEKFFDLIASIIAVKYIPEHLQIGETVNEIFYTKACWASFHKGIICMRKALADHYEAGAKVHGVNNWKKGIPVSDSERGGNFVDSMRRHTDQYLDDKTDEPHAIAAIWNAFCAAWTIKNK